jgi:hypothetical protein
MKQPIDALTGEVKPMATDTDVITIELEIDAAGDEAAQLQPGIPWRPAEHPDAAVIELAATEAGHGFGISEMITIVVTVAAGASSELIADAIRSAVGKVIRNAKTKSRQHSDGSREGLTKLVEAERSHSPTKDADQPPEQTAGE